MVSVGKYTINGSGQIIATSHDLGPQKVAKEGKWDPLFQKNLGREIDCILGCPRKLANG